MTRTGVVGILFVLLGIIWLAGCARPPSAEMDAATAAVAEAEVNDDVRLYAADSLARARNLLSRMNSEAKAKEYESARTLAQEATVAAEQAVRDGKAAKAGAREAAATALSAAKVLLSEAERALTSARELSSISLDVGAVAQELQSAADTVADAESDISSADYDAALSKAQNARQQLASILGRMSDAAQAATRAK